MKAHVLSHSPTITIKLPYVIKYVCQSLGICDVCEQIPKSIYYMSYLLLRDMFIKKGKFVKVL